MKCHPIIAKQADNIENLRRRKYDQSEKTECHDKLPSILKKGKNL